MSRKLILDKAIIILLWEHLKTPVQKRKKWYNRDMKIGQIGFFDEENRYKKLTELGDPLEKLNSVMDWEYSETN